MSSYGLNLNNENIADFNFLSIVTKFYIDASLGFLVFPLYFNSPEKANKYVKLFTDNDVRRRKKESYVDVTFAQLFFGINSINHEQFYRINIDRHFQDHKDLILYIVVRIADITERSFGGGRFKYYSGDAMMYNHIPLLSLYNAIRSLYDPELLFDLNKISKISPTPPVFNTNLAHTSFVHPNYTLSFKFPNDRQSSLLNVGYASRSNDSFIEGDSLVFCSGYNEDLTVHNRKLTELRKSMTEMQTDYSSGLSKIKSILDSVFTTVYIWQANKMHSYTGNKHFDETFYPYESIFNYGLESISDSTDFQRNGAIRQNSTLYDFNPRIRLLPSIKPLHANSNIPSIWRGSTLHFNDTDPRSLTVEFLEKYLQREGGSWQYLGMTFTGGKKPSYRGYPIVKMQRSTAIFCNRLWGVNQFRRSLSGREESIESFNVYGYYYDPGYLFSLRNGDLNFFPTYLTIDDVIKSNEEWYSNIFPTFVFTHDTSTLDKI